MSIRRLSAVGSFRVRIPSKSDTPAAVWVARLAAAILLFAAGALWATTRTYPYTALMKLSGIGHHLGPVALFTDTTDRTAVPCPTAPLVILAIGQSLAANTAHTFAEADTEPAFSIFDGRCYPIQDPMLGTGGRDGSLWPIVARQIVRAIGRPVVVISTAVGSTSIADWSDPAAPALSNTQRQLTLWRRPVDFVVWMHGEQDGSDGTDGDVYARGVAALSVALHVPGATWIITRETRSPNMSAAIRTAQSQAVRLIPGAVLGPDLDTITGANNRYDGIHLTGEGARIVARLIAADIVSWYRRKHANYR